MSKSRYSILIICEGDNTEPSFFNSIRDKIIKGEYNLDAAIKILPEPKVVDVPQEESDKHRSKRKKRELKAAIKDEPSVIKGVPPLKWVKAGIEELKSGTYNEVWTVFDHDNHPKRKEAFELAESSIVEGRKVNIAFTSRSFEYFLLLNFEQLYKPFNYTDCKDNDNVIDCGSGIHTSDCMGELCINGYARTKGYWDNSKAKESLYPLVEDRINIAFDNSAWLRNKSDIIEAEVPVYDRNPYTSVDLLISRLTGIRLKTWVNLDSETDGLLISKVNDSRIRIVNRSKKALLLVQDSFFAINIKNNEKELFGKRLVILPTQNDTVDIPIDLIESIDYLGVCLNGKTFLFNLI